MREAAFARAYPLALRAAQARAIAAVVRGILPRADREDAEQEGLIACWRALPHFDPTRASLPTFVEIIIARRIASLVRACHRQRALCPLDLAADHCADPAFRHDELRIDVERLLGACSDGERRLALLLMEHSPSQASRMLGVARSTVHARMRRLRPWFIAAGLGPRSLSGQRWSGK